MWLVHKDQSEAISSLTCIKYVKARAVCHEGTSSQFVTDTQKAHSQNMRMRYCHRILEMCRTERRIFQRNGV